MNPRRKSLAFAFWAFILPALVIPFYDIPRREVNTNERVRMYLTMALVEEGTTALDRQVERYGLPLDRAEKDGRIYCDKAPGLSFLAVPSYLPVFLLDRLLDYQVSFYLAVYLARISTVGLLSAVGLYFLLKLLRGAVGEDAAYFSAVVYLLGTIAFPLSAVFFGHQAAAALALLSFYLLKTGLPGRRRGRLFASGLLAGLAVMIEYPAVLIAAALFLLVAARRRDRPLVPFFAAGLLPAAAVLLIYNRVTFGAYLDFGYGYTGHYFRMHGLEISGISAALSLPAWSTLLRMAFSPYRGIFFFSPVLLFSIYGFRVLVRRGKKPETLLLAFLAAGYFLLNASLREWEGGWSPGLRHLAPVLPFLIFPLALTVRQIARRRSGPAPARAAGPLLAAAAIVSILGYSLITATYLYFPWGVSHPGRDITLVFLRQGRLALTLPGLLGLNPVPAALIFGGVILLPAGYFSRGLFRRLLPGPASRVAAVGLTGVWLALVLLLPPLRTERGERFLALIYWNHRLAEPFLESAGRIIASSPDPAERDRYRRAAAHLAREALAGRERDRYSSGMIRYTDSIE